MLISNAAKSWSNVVAVCGESHFRDSIRDKVLLSMNNEQEIEFTEAEFRPDSVRPAYPGVHALDPTDDIELGKFSIADDSSKGNRLTKLPPVVGEGSTRRSSHLTPSGQTSEDKERLVRSRSGRSETVEEADNRGMGREKIVRGAQLTQLPARARKEVKGRPVQSAGISGDKERLVKTRSGGFLTNLKTVEEAEEMPNLESRPAVREFV